MSRSILRHYTLSQVPHQDKRENVQKFINQSALMLSKPQKSHKLERKAREYDLESNTVSDANSMALQLSDPSTDILDGKRAVKKRLRDRKRRRRHLAEMRRSPPHRHSSPSSSRRRHFGRKIEEKKARKRARKSSPPVIQDRSRSKADRIRKESRSKEKEKSTRNKYLDLFQFNGASTLKRERITIPQPKLGIFSRGTANPYSVDKARVKDKKRKRSPSWSTDDEYYESSMAASMSGPPSFEIDEGDPSRIRALEEQIKELQTTVKSLNSSKKHNVQANEINTRNKDMELHHESARASRQSPPTHNNHTVVNLDHMPWSRDPVQQKQAESVIQDDPPPVLAFNGDKPDVHPNGWRAQHKLHDPGLQAIQKRFVDAGGANFVPAASTSVPRADQQKNMNQELENSEEAAQRQIAAGPCQADRSVHPIQRQARATYEILGAEDEMEDHYSNRDEYHLRDQFDLFSYDVPGNDYAVERSVRIRPQAAFRHNAYSLPDTTNEKVEYANRFRGAPAYDFDKHFDHGGFAGNANLQDEGTYDGHVDRFPQQISDVELNYGEALAQADPHGAPSRQDPDPLGDYVKDRVAVINYTYQEPVLEEDQYVYTPDEYTNDDSYEQQYADTIYSTEYSPIVDYSNYTNKHQDLNEDDLEGFWHPHRLI
ncbi:uncharacterized protein FA14DRAFT_37653 [Meira miltonrushii]|uniref:Uncharacterized protein n=1 Tax=Meira miltonrushii TaxID=1280837 RepID=A0A316VGH3_9BASI|nr:uncharacterized protein FA14DRAFT_37653 [Meira miltonrushii]PWN35101.1 hypothetical protein FA14DRAFT_37653 [Meira miltonrushii]